MKQEMQCHQWLRMVSLLCLVAAMGRSASGQQPESAERLPTQRQTGEASDESERAITLLADSLAGPLGDHWKWIREDKDAWRAMPSGLQLRLLPGNMWGPANDARNVLLTPVSQPVPSEVEIEVTVANAPTSQYEQVDLVWYYDESNMVKIGQELVDGQLSVVMGREQDDRTRTIAIIPLQEHRVTLRLVVTEQSVEGYFRTKQEPWTRAGACDLPEVGDKRPQISLQAYQGPADEVHWAQASDLKVRRRVP